MRYIVVEGDFSPYFKFAVEDTKSGKRVCHFNKRSSADKAAIKLNS
jgi:hypothetical protein